MGRNASEENDYESEQKVEDEDEDEGESEQEEEDERDHGETQSVQSEELKTISDHKGTLSYDGAFRKVLARARSVRTRACCRAGGAHNCKCSGLGNLDLRSGTINLHCFHSSCLLLRCRRYSHEKGTTTRMKPKIGKGQPAIWNQNAIAKCSGFNSNP